MNVECTTKQTLILYEFSNNRNYLRTRTLMLHQAYLPRVSYLSFLLPRLHAFFQSDMINADVIPHDGWFSFEDVPLKWQYPLGLLHDLFSGESPYESCGRQTRDDTSKERTGTQQPWRLTVHFTDWPEQVLVRPDAEGKVLHDAFINNVKEADFLRNGTAKGIMSLSKEDSTALWNSVQERESRLTVNFQMLTSPHNIRQS